MIVDCHCHAGHGDGLTGPWDTVAPLRQYLRRASEAGISRTVLLAAFHSDYRVANREVAAIVAGDRRRFLGFAFVHPVADKGRVAHLVREAVLRHGFCGIKVHRHDARITREICEAAARWQLPVLYDVAGEVSQVELLATEYRRVDFILPHLGSFADDWAAQRSVIDLLVRHRNVFTDTAGVRRFDLLAEAVARAGPHKVLFGTDGPWLHPAVELEKIYQLGLDANAERLVLGENLMRLTARARFRRGAVAAPDRSRPAALPPERACRRTGPAPP